MSAGRVPTPVRIVAPAANERWVLCAVEILLLSSADSLTSTTTTLVVYLFRRLKNKYPTANYQLQAICAGFLPASGLAGLFFTAAFCPLCSQRLARHVCSYSSPAVPFPPTEFSSDGRTGSGDSERCQAKRSRRWRRRLDTTHTYSTSGRRSSSVGPRHNAARRYRSTAGTRGVGSHRSISAARARAAANHPHSACRCCCRSTGQTDGRTDGRTPDRYKDAHRWKREASVTHRIGRAYMYVRAYTQDTVHKSGSRKMSRPRSLLGYVVGR